MVKLNIRKTNSFGFLRRLEKWLTKLLMNVSTAALARLNALSVRFQPATTSMLSTLQPASTAVPVRVSALLAHLLLIN
jgi:hypothetical protein